MRIWLLSIAFALGATSTPALADQDAGVDAGPEAAAPYVTQVIPACKVFDVPMLGPVCGYQFLDDWKAVARADAELVRRRAEVLALEAQRDAERDRAVALEEALQVRADQVGHLVVELDAERARLLELDRKYQDARGTPWHAWVGWGVATVAAGVIAGVLLSEVIE